MEIGLSRRRECHAWCASIPVLYLVGLVWLLILVSAMFAFRSQPLKFAYLLVAIPVTLFIRLPYWVFISAVPAFRPRKSWGMKRALGRHVFAATVAMFYDIGLPPAEGSPDKDSASPGATGFVWVDPVPSELVTGELSSYASRNHVQPARVYGYWYGARDESGKHGQRAIKGERVFYYLRGQSFPTLAIARTLT